jgi:5-methylcytosine-specific restriction protein A
MNASARNPAWPALRAGHLISHPACAACGITHPVEVHHIRPREDYPSLELDPDNLVTLCQNHHFTLGHFSSWSRSNPEVVKDAAGVLAALRRKLGVLLAALGEVYRRVS